MNGDTPQPIATYRLQFNKTFRFADAQALVPYFSRLGITHVYASPILRARQASTHGYDVVDPKTINPNLGDKTDLVELVHDLRKFGLGLVLDIVPNHMAASIENPYWRDVLTYGHSSPFARWFDIDWRMPDPEMWGRVLVPVLGEPRARVLEQDQIQLAWSEGRFLVRYFEHVFPVDPATTPMICAFGIDDLTQRLQQDHSALDKIAEILAYLKTLPKLAARLRRHVDIDREATEQWLAKLATVIVRSPRLQQWAEETAARFGQGEDGRRRLKKLLDSQPYRLVHWRDAARTINYRRFFDINELVSVRQEDPHVFDETHSTVLRWVEDGLIDGLRIDHIDGLRDPLGYLERLSEKLSSRERIRGSCPIFVEKILAANEQLPCDWPVAGTTGYEFLNEVEALFVSPTGFGEIQEHYRRMLRRNVDFGQIAAAGKRRILRNDLSPHVGRLADLLLRHFESSRQPAAVIAAAAAQSLTSLTTSEDSTANGARPLSAASASPVEPSKRDFVDAIVEVITALPVYRTYVDSNTCSVSDAERQFVETALCEARQAGRAAPEAIDFLGEVLLLENKTHLPERELQGRVSFIERFQQLTGPAAAKGVEDTALYAYVPLISLNEVGGEPELPDDPRAGLHHANVERADKHPQSMLCLTTHDTKRTSDVRARLDVLSELPKLWSGLVRRWQRLNQAQRSRIDGKHAPDAVAEYLFYQTIVGIWPAPDPSGPNQPPSHEVLADLCQRVEHYMLKAVREAKVHTSWTSNNQRYEEAVVSFVRSLLQYGENVGPFLSDVRNLVARIARPGFWNSLSRTLIQFTAPGTPDLYQGDELWNFALVDPDNRRAVDFEARRSLLDEIITGIEGHREPRREFIRSLIQSPEDSRIKLHLIHSASAARREHPQLFANSQYTPLATDGSAKDHLLAFARAAGAPRTPSASFEAAVIIAPRLTTALVSEPSAAPIGESVWTDTVVQLPDPLRNRTWICALTREPIDSPADGKLLVSQALRSLPAALLLSGEPQRVTGQESEKPTAE